MIRNKRTELLHQHVEILGISLDTLPAQAEETLRFLTQEEMQIVILLVILMETGEKADEVGAKLTKILEAAKAVLIQRLQKSSNSTYEYIRKLIEDGLISYHHVGNFEGTVFKDTLNSEQIKELQALHRQLHK